MRRSILMLVMVITALWAGPAFAQARTQLGPLCTSYDTPADQQIDACNKILALKVFSGEKLANIYFWRAVGWNKKGHYAKVIADTSEARPAAASASDARSRDVWNMKRPCAQSLFMQNASRNFRETQAIAHSRHVYGMAERLDPNEPISAS
jgi:hypothetical protein